MLCLFIIIKKEFIYKNDSNFLLHLFEDVKNVQGWGESGRSLQKFSRLIYCGPGVFILKVE